MQNIVAQAGHSPGRNEAQAMYSTLYEGTLSQACLASRPTPPGRGRIGALREVRGGTREEPEHSGWEV